MSAGEFAPTPGDVEPTPEIDKLLDDIFGKTYPDTPGDIEVEPPPTIRECVLFLAGHDPDRARVINGVGFNKFDGDYGHKLATKPESAWTEWDNFNAYKMLAKYAKTQLIPAGLAYDRIKPPSEPKKPEPFRRVVDGEFELKLQYGGLEYSELRDLRNAVYTELSGFRWSPTEGNTLLVGKDGPSLAKVLRFIIKHDFQIDPDLLHALQQIIRDAEAIVKASKGTSLKAIGITDWKFNGTYNTEWRGVMMPHQEVGLWYIEKAIKSLHVGGVQIGDEMGLGKTWEALLAAEHMFTADDWGRGLLCLVPTHLGINWELTARNLLPHRKVSRLASGRFQSIDADIVIVPYSILRYEKNPTTFKLEPNDVLFQLLVRPWAGIVCDESHYLKNDEAMRTSASREIFEQANPWFRIGMSGTSAVNRAPEFSNQLEMLGVIKLFGSKFAWEREAAHYPVELNGRMREKGVYLRREKTDVLYCHCPDRSQLEKDTIACPVCGGIPIKRREVVQLELDDEWRKKYEFAETQFRKWLLEEYHGDMQKFLRSLRAELLVRITKLSKLLAEAKTEPFTEWHRDFLEESDQKVVMFAHHVDVQQKLIESFPDTAYILGSQFMSDNAKWQQERKFQTDEKIRTMVYTTLGATGRDLTASSNVSFLELEWGPAPHDQAEDRCNRIGSQRMLNSRFFLATGNTIDNYRMAMIDAKRRITTALNKGEEVDDSSLLAKMLGDFIAGKEPSAADLAKTYNQESPAVDPEEERRQKYDESTGREL